MVTKEHPTGLPLQPTDHDEASDAGSGEVGAHTSGLAIIPSKIAAATRGRSVMTRPRLAGWFERQTRARLILVSAEAGYGKSTLLNEHALNSIAKCVWYRIETSDGDWITFLSYMVAAMRQVAPDFGRSTEALLRHVAAMGSSREVVLSQFLADLGTLDLGPTDIILDDYHLIERSEDVRMILGRLLERGPHDMRIILSGRGRPNLALGRLLAQGQVSELTIDDLRFTKPEINELFSVTYRQPLDRDACDVIAERTEGWAASLQLVSASIAVSRPSEVAAFIEALDGAKGPIYDFLAEEVLTRLSARTQRILVHASLIDRVRPELVSAALSVLPDPPDAEAVAAALEDAETLGLFADRGAETGGRIHPLFRQFLAHHLELVASATEIRRMHLAIAIDAEAIDWLVSAKHFALAQEPDEAMRVMGSAASDALGTGAWGAAVQIVDLMPDTAPPPSVEVIKARALVSDGQTPAALSLLATLDAKALTPEEQGLVALTRAAAFHIDGEGALLAKQIHEIATLPDVPSPLREVALAWRQMLRANDGGSITDAVRSLARLSADQRRAQLHYFAGVSLHNTANGELARGRYSDANRLAVQAIAELQQTDAGTPIVASSKSISAISMAELGNLSEGLEAADAAATESDSTADAIAEAAYLNAIIGNTRTTRSLLAKFDKGESTWSRELSSRALACCARVALNLSEGKMGAAGKALAALESIKAPDVDSKSRLAVVKATLAILERSANSKELASEAVEAAASQEAWRWMARARILDAVASDDADSLGLWINESETESALALLELADVISLACGILVPVPKALERSIVQAPNRWVPALRRQVQAQPRENVSLAATLLAQFGTMEDAAILRHFDSANEGNRKRRGLTTRLVRRVSPTVRIHDLGPTSYEVGTRHVPLTETRRKAAALMLYLVTRPELSAAKEQVMENLWPDQSPKSAVNSLHQTLFFLRRDIEPWYEDGTSADYVRLESDMVFLDTDLFQVDSVAFSRQAAGIATSGKAGVQGPEMLRLYRGGFAPEFEYEEWANDWRSHLHGTYLHLARCTVDDLINQRRYSEVVDVLVPVVAIDPSAFDLRASLVACLAALGSHDAAITHYKNLAALHSRDLGVPAPAYAAIVGELSP
jgi:DNA-binding SARP family transcriptional activator